MDIFDEVRETLTDIVKVATDCTLNRHHREVQLSKIVELAAEMLVDLERYRMCEETRP